MPRIVKAGLIQTSLAIDTNEPIEKIREAQTERTLKYLEQAAQEGVQIICFQEIFTGPYFCAEQNTRWYDAVEKIPDGPTTRLMQEYARRYNMVIVVPIYEEESTGVYYNTAAVIDADGTYLGKYRKNHIPHVAPGFWEKFYFRPGNLGYPVFKTKYATVGVYICYDRHFPEGARELGLAGAEIVFNPSATVAGLSEYLWKLEQPAHAVANGYYVGAINRVGTEAPWNIGKFYGTSYFVNPRGKILVEGSEDKDEVVTADPASGTPTTRGAHNSVDLGSNRITCRWFENPSRSRSPQRIQCCPFAPPSQALLAVIGVRLQCRRVRYFLKRKFTTS